MPASNNTFGYTQTQIAEMSGLHQSHISKYLTGKSVPTLKNIMKIANACNVSLEEVSMFIMNKHIERKGM